MRESLLSVVHPPRILVVDDTRSFCQAAGVRLSALGVEAIPAQSGEDAFRCVRELTPESALVDFRLNPPDADGVHVATDIKGILPQLAVVLITAFDLETIRIQTPDTAVDGFFHKRDVDNAFRYVVRLARDRRGAAPWVALAALLAAIDAPARKADDRTRNVISKVCLDLKRNWSQSELSRAAGGIGRRQLLRAFKRSFGMPPGRFVTRLRVEAAKIYLRNHDLSQEAVARKTGLASERNLHKVFKRIEGCAPGEFR